VQPLKLDYEIIYVKNYSKKKPHHLDGAFFMNLISFPHAKQKMGMVFSQY
jgi:hypothetical protein